MSPAARKKAEKAEILRQAREKALKPKGEPVPCVDIGCSADMPGEAEERRKLAEARRDEVRKQSADIYQTQRERNDNTYSKQTEMTPETSLLTLRMEQAELEALAKEEAAKGNAEPPKDTYVPSVGAGIFGSGAED